MLYCHFIKRIFFSFEADQVIKEVIFKLVDVAGLNFENRVTGHVMLSPESKHAFA